MEEKYFKSAGDLAEEVTKESNPFMMGGDLTDEVKKETNPFMMAGDLTDEVKNVTTVEDINDYLLTVVSGKKIDYKCELGTLCGAGRTVVSLDKLKEMVLNGYNIVSAKCINSNMIDVEFQEYKKNTVNNIRR